MIAAALTTLALTVAPGGTATTSGPNPLTVSSIAVTVNGRDAIYERFSSCAAYIYGGGVVARLSACGRKLKLSAASTSTRYARVRVTLR